MLSGIGPAGHLRELGIEVHADVPEVGANLQDHPLTFIICQVSRPVAAGSSNNVEAIAALSSGLSHELPDVQLFVGTMPVNPPPLPTPDNGFGIGVAVTAPRSRGTVRLNSSAPWVPPLTDLGLLADAHDLDVLDFGLREARTIAAAPALADWKATEVFPAGLILDEASRRAFLRQAVSPYYHPVGTCRLGSDPGSVVDLELRVRGIDGLRVADASVMPSIPTANTNATVLAIAERAAALLTGRCPPVASPSNH